MNWDAMFMIAGMIIGSFIFAEISGYVSRTIQRFGDRGKLVIPEALGFAKSSFVVGFILILAVCLIALELFD